MNTKIEQQAQWLGRIPSPEDPRDKQYPARRLFQLIEPRVEAPTGYQKWYGEVWTGDQGPTGRCTAFSMLHLLHDGPFTHRPYWDRAPMMDPTELYRKAQCLDEWGCRSADDGTTMRAICQATRSFGLADHFWWFESVHEVFNYLATRGPVLMGTWWREGMEEPRQAPGEPYDGMVKYSGKYLGGHAYKPDEINMDREYIGFKNSWGTDWGDHGRFRMSFRDFETLFNEDGEVLAVTEKRLEEGG